MKAPDPDHFLRQACLYIHDHRVDVASDPRTWTIRRVEKQVVGGVPRTVVYYSCCYLGDFAIFDASGKLVQYIAGAK